MASRIFERVIEAAETGAFPRARKWFWKRLYWLLSVAWRDGDWRFMNYGHAPEVPFPLAAEHEADRGFIGLYEQAVTGLPVQGAEVLEIGSGRGGGAAYVAAYHRPAKMVGADFSAATVKRAIKLNDEGRALSFVVGDAEALPFDDASFDIVLNIESSHCYGDQAAFVAEVARVLRPGGIFTWADIRAAAMMPMTEQAFDHPDLELLSADTITPGVLRALDMLSERKAQRIARVPLISGFLKEFAATQGTTLYNAFADGEATYLARRYRRR